MFLTITSQVPLGVQISCAIRVGQYLGAGQGIQAKTVGNLAITIVCESLSLPVCLFVMENVFFMHCISETGAALHLYILK